jgi:hypothetical protein
MTRMVIFLVLVRSIMNIQNVLKHLEPSKSIGEFNNSAGLRTSSKPSRFKLKMCPGERSQDIRHATAKVFFPKNKRLADIYADFMGYLLQCTEKYFRDHFPRGKQRWKTLFPAAHFVIGHPNGWEGAPQACLRRAAVLSGLVSRDTIEDRARIHFVTEGEASLHYCLHAGIINETVQVTFNSVRQN